MKTKSKVPKKKTRLPDTVKDTLLEFTMVYLLEQPENLHSYARSFFDRMEEARHTTMEYEVTSSSDESTISSDSIPVEKGPIRRGVVYGESYDPAADKEEFVKPVHPKTEEERRTLQRVAKHTLLFRALDEEQLEDVINAMFKRETQPGDVIIRQGDDGDNFYVIEHGYYDVFMAKPGGKPEHIFMYENSGNFGELALLYNQPRAATVIAKTYGVIWALDRKTFRKLVMQSAHEKRELYQQFVKTIPVLSELESYEKLNIADVLVPRKFQAGEMIMQQGNEPDGMYFVEKGSVSVRVMNKIGREVPVAEIGVGGYFGELELVTKLPREASVYAEEDTRLAFLDEEAFDRFMGPCTDTMMKTIEVYNEQRRRFLGSESATIRRISCMNLPTLSEESLPTARGARRGVVFGESYDPTKDTEEFVKPVHPKTDEERQTLEKVAKKTLLFRALDEEQLEDVINAMFKRETKPGDVIIKQGDDGDNFYVIERGNFDVFMAKPGEESKHIFVYENTGNFGELALLYNQPRAATVVAQTDGVIWALDRKTFRKLVMQSAHEKRAMYEQFIKTVPMMSELGSYERLNIADVLIPRKFKKGEIVIQQGDDADGMYFVEKGSVTVKVKSKAGREEELNKIETGGYFGELALVTEGPRIATVYADDDNTRLAFLDIEAFERFMGPCLEVMKRNIDHYKEEIRRIFGSAQDILV